MKCPKCPSGRFGAPHYCVSGHGLGTSTLGTGPEHLHYRCGTCGYDVQEACVDAVAFGCNRDR